MSVSQHELHQLATAVSAHHAPLVVAAASMAALTRKLFRDYGARHKTNLEPLVAFQDTCIGRWAENEGIEQEAIDAATTALEKAAETAANLDLLDDDLPPLQHLFPTFLVSKASATGQIDP
jgi:hypothetical protein